MPRCRHRLDSSAVCSAAATSAARPPPAAAAALRPRPSPRRFRALAAIVALACRGVLMTSP